MSRNILIKGKCYWAYLHEPDINEEFGYSRYSINLVVDATEQKKLISAGIKLKNTADFDKDKGFKGKFIEPRSNLYDQNGKKRPPIPVIDVYKNKIDTTVGNGSDVVVSIYPYHWKKAGSEGVSPILKAVMVTNLISYEKDESNEDPLAAFDELADF